MKQALLLALLSLTLWADAHLFVYHRFGDAKHASTNTSLQVLEKQFKYFQDNHYKVIPLKRLYSALKRGEKIPDNWVVLCIDDSYKSFYDNGLALFKKYHYPFSLFVYIEATQKAYGDFMTWKQIREAAMFGEIGLHSYGHKHMVSMSTEEIKEDTSKALKLFENNMGFRPQYYAYPYGEFDEDVEKAIASFGFKLILNQNVGAVSEKSPLHSLDRIALTGDVNLKTKLRIKFLEAKWFEPKSYPKNAKLNKIHVTMSPSIKKAELYVSGGGWEYIKLKEGRFESTKSYPLKFRRTRIIIKHGNAYTSKIIVKK